MNIIKKIKNYFKVLHENDPVYSCTLYKEIGCSHVDGFLCDFPDCSMNNDYIAKKIINMSDSDILRNLSNNDKKSIKKTRKMIKRTIDEHHNKRGNNEYN